MAAPTEAPAPTAPPAGPIALTVTARKIRFEQTELTVDAGAQVTLTFDNQDSVSHNIDIEGVAKTDIFAGPGQRTVTFTAPTPGSYPYRCDVHPGAMRGTLIVR
jgi:plastocyanin